MVRDGRADESVVVPASGTPSTVGCLRSLGRMGVRTIVVSEDRTAPSFASKYCDEAVLTPGPTEDLDGYAEALFELSKREAVRTIVPVREVDIYVLAKHREAFAEHVGAPWPTFEELQWVHDRVRLGEAAAAAGVPYPRTTPLREVETWNRPAVVKSRYNLLAEDYVADMTDGTTDKNKSIQYLEPGEVPDEDALCETFGHEPIVQEYVPFDDEYMVGAVYRHGEELASIQHHQIRGTSYTHGGGVYRRSIDAPDLAAVARQLLEHLDWHGPACLEYMQDPETGAFKLAEINPRMWMSVSANIRMGADIPRAYWLAATDRTDRIDPGYDTDVTSQYLKGEVSYLASIVGEDSPFVEPPSIAGAIRLVVMACVSERTFDVLERDDPWPFFADLARELDRRTPVSVSVGPLVQRLANAHRPRRHITGDHPLARTTGHPDDE